MISISVPELVPCCVCAQLKRHAQLWPTAARMVCWDCALSITDLVIATGILDVRQRINALKGGSRVPTLESSTEV